MPERIGRKIAALAFAATAVGGIDAMYTIKNIPNRVERAAIIATPPPDAEKLAKAGQITLAKQTNIDSLNAQKKFDDIHSETDEAALAKKDEGFGMSVNEGLQIEAQQRNFRTTRQNLRNARFKERLIHDAAIAGPGAAIFLSVWLSAVLKGLHRRHRSKKEARASIQHLDPLAETPAVSQDVPHAS